MRNWKKIVTNPIFIIVVVIVIVIAFLILPFSSGFVRKFEINIDLVDEGDMPRIENATWTRKNFSPAEWLIHEQQKFEIVGARYTIRATLCDPPSDCDSDQEKFDWVVGSERGAILYVPSFIGAKHDVIIELFDGDQRIDDYVIQGVG